MENPSFHTHPLSLFTTADRMADPWFAVGASIWAKETIITSAAELHPQFGRNDLHTWISGIVSKDFI